MKFFTKLAKTVTGLEFPRGCQPQMRAPTYSLVKISPKLHENRSGEGRSPKFVSRFATAKVRLAYLMDPPPVCLHFESLSNLSLSLFQKHAEDAIGNPLTEVAISLGTVRDVRIRIFCWIPRTLRNGRHPGRKANTKSHSVQ